MERSIEVELDRATGPRVTARTVGDLRFVLIWSDEHRAWWRPDGMGYSKRIAEAGLYDPENVVRDWMHGETKFHHVVQLGAARRRRKSV